MPTDDETYDVALMESAALAVADSDDEAKELLHFAKPTSMMTREEQIIMFAKVLRDVKTTDILQTAELRRTNDLIEANSKRMIWLVQHTASCISAWFSAMQKPKLLIPTVAVVAFVALFALGQGDRAMDITESLIEKYAGVDIHGHADAKPE